MKTVGHVTEEVHDWLGFNFDTNYDGEKVNKLDNIFQETRHRAKVLR